MFKEINNSWGITILDFKLCYRGIVLKPYGIIKNRYLYQCDKKGDPGKNECLHAEKWYPYLPLYPDNHIQMVEKYYCESQSSEIIRRKPRQCWVKIQCRKGLYE